MQSHAMYLEQHHRGRSELMRQAQADRLTRLAREAAPARQRRFGLAVVKTIRRQRPVSISPTLRPTAT